MEAERNVRGTEPRRALDGTFRCEIAMTRIASGMRPDAAAGQRREPWRGVIYYGEVFGFLAAWVVGVIVALANQPEKARDAGPREMAAADARSVLSTP